MIALQVDTAGQAILTVTDTFKKAGLETPQLDARVLIAAALEIDSTQLFSYPETKMSETQLERLQGFVARRMNHEPVARILGIREFWSLEFKVDESTLVPRPDSETLIDTVLRNVDDPQAELSILDVGTGSGCLALSLLSELLNARALATDINPAALRVAQQNAQALGYSERIEFKQATWLENMTNGLLSPFDMIVSNPPYIPNKDIEQLEPDVAQFDPHLALSGGEDGLDAYRQLLPQLSGHIKASGLILLEIGWNQATDVADIGARAGFIHCETLKDLAGHDRVVLFRATSII